MQSILNPSATNKNYDQAIEDYNALRNLVHRLGLAIIIVLYCEKRCDIHSAPLEKVIGSIGITVMVETILIIAQLPGSKDCKFRVAGKDVEQCDKHLNWTGRGFEIGNDVREAQLVLH